MLVEIQAIGCIGAWICKPGGRWDISGVWRLYVQQERKGCRHQRTGGDQWDVANHSGPELVELLRRYQALGMDVNNATTTVFMLQVVNPLALTLMVPFDL
ncbi:unnamed protein product [Prunus armeniaca]|uniref:Uncharacterized protein n=1 Tax=Prunus armeniaca TaxID=36596 RepID=A0A6J5WEQ7_PRUAR|nr:unnamed protein product [Prunus armeniaca]